MKLTVILLLMAIFSPNQYVLAQSSSVKNGVQVNVFALKEGKKFRIHDLTVKVIVVSPSTGDSILLALKEMKGGAIEYFADSVPDTYTVVIVDALQYETVRQEYTGDYYMSPYGGMIRTFKVELRNRKGEEKNEKSFKAGGIVYYINPDSQLIGIALSDSGRKNIEHVKVHLQKEGFELIKADAADPVWVIKMKRGKVKKKRNRKLASLRNDVLISKAGPLLDDDVENPKILSNQLVITGVISPGLLRKAGLTLLSGPAQGNFHTYKLSDDMGYGVLEIAEQLEKDGTLTVEPVIFYGTKSEGKKF